MILGCGQSSTPPTSTTLESIAVTPASQSIAVGATQQFTATGSYSNGTTANITSSVTWSSSSTAAATVSTAGVATAVAAGSSTITATASGVSGTATLAVTASTPTLTAIAVTPASPSIAVGATQQFTATATYSNATTANVTSSVTWSSSSTATATVNTSGVATGVAAGTTTITAALNGYSGIGTLTVTASSPPTLSSIAVTPNPASFTAGSAEQFTATGTYSDGSTKNLTSTVTWTSSNTSAATINASGLATGVAAGSSTITAATGGVSGQASATVNAATTSTGNVNITTWHVDANRSGLNSKETVLTPSNVNSSSFGKLFSYLVDGYVYGEPLIVSDLTINGAKHDVLFVATEKDTVYAFDADNYGSGAPLWSTSLLKSGESPLTNGPIQPYEGVTSTPVIDTSTNTIYVVSEQTSSSGGTFRLSALDLATGAQKLGGPVTINASVAGTNPKAGNGTTVTLTTGCVQRAALLEANGNIYIGVGGCPTGWLLAYSASTLRQVAVFNMSPNLAGEGTYASAGGVWMGGGGPVADSSGNIYVSTGNGPWDGNTAWGDSVMKFSPTLQLEDYFTPDDYAFMNCYDSDLAAGGVMMIPGTNEMTAGGKSGKIYLVNTGNMGHEQANDAGATQTLWFESDLTTPYSQSCSDSSGTHTTDINPYEIFGTPAYYNGSIFLGIAPTGSGVPAAIRQFVYNGTLTPGAYTNPSIQENSKGITPFISANGNADGIVWVLDQGVPLQAGTSTKATLRAYDADNFPNEIYNSSQNSADVPGYGIKFTSAVEANGKVYISTGHDLTTVSNPQGEIDVYGLK